MDSLGPELVKLVEIIWINIILSGDNAVVIAMACRGLPHRTRRTGMLLGALAAVALRILFTVLIAALLTTPFLKIAGAGFLLWIAVNLVIGEDDEGEVRETDRLWQAVRTVVIADAFMSLDNVLAIAAVAQGSTVLLVVGLAVSIPLIVAGAALIMSLLNRFPILVWAGAALLGWVAGEMLVSDPWLVERLGTGMAERIEWPAGAVCAVLVVGIGMVLKRRTNSRKVAEREV